MKRLMIQGFFGNQMMRSILTSALVLAGLGAIENAAGQTIAITGGTVHTGTGQVIQRGTVLMVDGQIAAVGSDVTIPEGAQRVDASGKVVTPGLFDAYTGLGLVEIGAESNTADNSVNNDRISAAFNVADGLNPNATALAVTRVDGVTRAVVTPSSFQKMFHGQGLVINLGADSFDDMVLKDPAAQYVAMGEAGARAAGGARGAATLMLREALDDARDYARNREAFNGGRRRDYAMSRLDLEALVPVVRGTVPMVVLVHRASDIRAVLRLASDYDIQLILAGVQEGHRVADEIASAGVPVLVNAMTNLPTFEALSASHANAGLMYEAGVQVVLASFDANNSRNLRQVAGFATAYGMPREAALAAITRVPAEVFGLDDRLGTLEVGKVADAVIWTGDPFEVTEWAEQVFIDGRPMSDETRQKALFERYRDLSRLPPWRN